MSFPKDQPYHGSYQAYRHEAGEPQELPADTIPPAEHSYSELPAEGPSSNTQRVSELPSGSFPVAAELESRQTSPRPTKGEFAANMAKQMDQTAGTASG
jgi:hypothetical protein